MKEQCGIKVWYAPTKDQLFLTWDCYAKTSIESDEGSGHIEMSYYAPIGTALDNGNMVFLIGNAQFTDCEFIGFL